MRPIKVWNWRDAPTWLKALSHTSDDVDWIGLVPRDLEIPGWMESSQYDTCHSPHIVTLSNTVYDYDEYGPGKSVCAFEGDYVVVGTHA